MSCPNPGMADGWEKCLSRKLAAVRAWGSSDGLEDLATKPRNPEGVDEMNVSRRRALHANHRAMNGDLREEPERVPDDDRGGQDPQERRKGILR
jgi:hypothetical protein